MFPRHVRLVLAAAASFAALAVVGLTAAGDESPLLASRYLDGGITIDGVADDWPELTPIGTKPHIEAAFANDSVYLYAGFLTADRGARMEVLRQGLIVWFDARGGDRKRFGVHYPDTALPTRRQPGERRDGPPPGAPGAGPEPAEQDEGRWQRLEILGPDKDDVRSLMLDYASGVEVAVGDREGVVFYELRVPLRVTPETPYAIGTTPGSEIGIGLETKKVETPGRPGGRGMFGGFGGMRGGGIPGGGPPGAGRDGERGGGERPPKLEPIKIWTKVALQTKS